MRGAEMNGEGGRGAASRRRLRRLLLATIALLYVVSVPWYRAADARPGLWLGLPDWVTVAVLCYVGVAVLNAIAWLVTDVDDDGPLPEGLADDAPVREATTASTGGDAAGPGAA